MNGPGAPSPDYLAQIAQTLGGAPPPTGPVMLGGPPPPPAPMDAPIMSPMPAPAPPPMSSAATPAPMPAPPMAPPGPAPEPRRATFLQQVGAAGSFTAPAHETELRGPHLQQAQGERNAAFEGAVKAVTERSEATAAQDYALALEQERKAGIREDAANHTMAERAEEMAQRQADFEASTKAMSEAGQLDQGRFFSDASALSKIGMLAALFAGGLAEAKGGRNTGLDAIKAIREQDIKAQEFAYNATRDTANAKQTAFSMAMQKYNNVDAARAAARAAAIDVTQAQLGKQAALWKGTEAANRAQMAIASLEDEKMQQIAHGIMFTPARQVSVGASYVDPRTGMRYSEQEAKGLVAKMDEQEFKREEKGTDVAGQLLVEGVKAGAKGQEKADEGAKFISTQLQQAGVPQARSAAEAALKALNEDPGGPGEATFRAVTPDAIAHTVASHKSNAREQAYSKFSNAAVKAIMGNATEAERARMVEDLGRASDPESRRRAIANVLNDLEAIEKNARAGAAPAAQKDFSERRGAAEGAPPNAPKGSKNGW